MVKTKIISLFMTLKSRSRWLMCMILSQLIITSCQLEEVTVTEPARGSVKIQMRNFNVPLKGGTLNGTAPDIYYFKQQEDRSYSFMLTSTNYGNFETNWATDYVLVQTDKTGVVQKTEVKKLPSKDGIMGTLEYVWDAPSSSLFPGKFSQLPLNRATSGPSYVADEQGLLYYQPQTSCYCKNQVFNLNPETGNADFVSLGAAPVLARLFRTSDGGFISVGGQGSPDFAKYSKSGALQFKQPMKYWETRPSYEFLIERNGDFYFMALYNGGYSTYDFPSTTNYDSWFFGELMYENFSENKATSFFNLKESVVLNDFEIRFGPGKKQKAHRFIYTNGFFGPVGVYQDYVEVPFELWDLEQNRQVMVSFRDQRGDGKFDLVPYNYDKRAELDPAHSHETIWPHTNEYSEIPNQSIMSGFFLSFEYIPPSFIWPYLAEGVTWNDTELPNSIFSQKGGENIRPGPQVIKVNANGSTIVKDNFVLGSGPLSFKTLYKSVPYKDGFAVLINAQQVTNDASDRHLGVYGYQPTQLVILDANFNQTNVIPVESRPEDYGHQMESNKDQIFYARITTNPGSTVSNVSLLLSTVQNNTEIRRYLDFDVETYRIALTKTGGVALVAWVRPTANTRDLIFMEFDKNLELIASNGN